jgi:hypothetical protein
MNNKRGEKMLAPKKIICNCCLKSRKEYIPGICKPCADKIDNHIQKEDVR